MRGHWDGFEWHEARHLSDDDGDTLDWAQATGAQVAPEETTPAVAAILEIRLPSEYLAQALRAEAEGDAEAIAAERRYARDLEEAEAPDLDGVDDESVFGIVRRACRLGGHPELSEQAAPDMFDAFAAVRRQMSPAAFQALVTLYATGKDYHPYFSVLTPVVWARCVRLTPDQWMGLYEFVQSRRLPWSEVF